MDIEYRSWVVTCPNKLIGKSKDEIEQEYWKAWEAVLVSMGAKCK